MKPRRSANSTATSRSAPPRGSMPSSTSPGPASAGRSGATARSAKGRIWQASLTSGVRPDPGQHAPLLGRGRRQLLGTLADPHPAGRAAPAAAADRGVRDAARPARLEHGEAPRHGDGAAAGVGEPHGAAALDEPAQATRREQAEHQPLEAGDDARVRTVDQPLPLLARRPALAPSPSPRARPGRPSGAAPARARPRRCRAAPAPAAARPGPAPARAAGGTRPAAAASGAARRSRAARPGPASTPSAASRRARSIPARRRSCPARRSAGASRPSPARGR